VLLSRVEETLVVAGDRYDLGTNQYPGTIHPRGFQYLVRFRLDPFPIWTFRVGDVELEKQFFLVHGDRVAVLQYSLRAPTGAPDARLEVRPLIAFRDYHSLSHENPALNAGFSEEDGRVGLRPYPDLPELFLGHSAARVEAQGWWYRRFQYEEERTRGLEWEEDLFCPCVLTYDLGTAGRGALIASLEPRRAGDAPELEETERRRRASLDGAAPVSTRLVRALSRAADQFVVRRGDGATIVAGYPWFTDWGRDP